MSHYFNTRFDFFKSSVKKRERLRKILLFKSIRVEIQNVLSLRKQLICSLYKAIKSFYNNYVDKFSKNVSLSELKMVYGGPQQHSMTTDFKKEKLNYKYETKLDVNNNYIIQNASLPAFNSSMECQLDRTCNSLNDLDFRINNKLCFRQCDEKCVIPEEWPFYLLNCFKILQPTYSLNLLQCNIIQFEKCTYCYQSSSRCKNKSCQDNIAYLNSLSKHFVHLRTIKRQIYNIREINLQIINIDKYLTESSLNELRNLNSKSDNLKKISFNEISKNRIIYFDKNKYESYLIDFKNDLQNRLNLLECSICHKLMNRTKLKIISANDYQNDIIQKILNSSIGDNLYICTQECYKQIFKEGIIPKYSKLNNMELQKTPEQIQSLNFFEKTLIQLAKCFLSTIRLKTVSKKKSGIKALKGLAIHLPLTFESTHDYISDTLPNLDAFNIIVYGLPTVTNNIWRDLIDLDKVYSAINWLSLNNAYYDTNKIKIDYSYRANNSALIKSDLNIQNKENSTAINEKAPYLNHLKNQAFNHYTVIDLDKLNTNHTDIEKYSMKKVIAQPIQDKDRDMDHLCFVDIFSKGTGGMYDERTFEVKPAMYARWIIMNKNPVARRNIQYLFHLLHNKDIRAADSGIYASLKTSKMKNISAKTMINHIRNDTKELESNLSTTLSAVRGSKEYWSRICSDLKACEVEWGHAKVFFTISCNEWEWYDLLQFIKYMNQDVPNINNFDYDQLINLDPVSVSIFYENKSKSFFNKLLLNKNGPFGEISHYFYRTEYQQRGAPHIHGILWIKDCPTYGESPDSEVLKWIETHITCRLPDPILEPELYEKVKKYQVHHDNSSCQRLVNGMNQKKAIICRYGFPRSQQPFIKLNTLESVMQSKLCGNKPIKIYSLQRSADEVFINDYNEYMLLIWDGNVDVQYIGCKSFSLHKYITDYISKAEHNHTQEIWDECNSNRTIRGNN